MFGLIDAVIVRPITNILFVIYGFVGDFGLAIILFTILVKLCLWPLARRQLHQTRLMRKIQPELAEIKKNCNGNRQLESLQMMDLYKRNNIKPFRSVLTIIIQLPIFIALYTAVRVMVVPTPTDNLSVRAYAPVRQIDRVEEVINLQTPYLEQLQTYQDAKAKDPNADIRQPNYEFQPKLFGLVSLSAKPGVTSASAVIMLLFAICSAFSQFLVSRQQLPSNKSQKSRTFRQLMKEAAGGKEPDQTELNQVMSKQMSLMMPIMMLLIMLNLPGALVFYYFISNLITIAQQKIFLDQKEEEMEIAADKKIIRELKKIEEAEIVEPSDNKNRKPSQKSGQKITRISAKSRKSHKKKRS